MSTWWKVSKYYTKIEPEEVVRDTESQLVVMSKHSGKERRISKHTSYDDYFETWESARDHLIQRTEHDIRSAKERLGRSESELAQIKSLTNPAQ